MGAELQSRVSWGESGVSVCVLKHLGVLFAMLAGSKGPSFGADTDNSEDEYGVAKSNVMWPVASVGKLKCQALEKIGRFVIACDAVPHRLRRHHALDAVASLAKSGV